MNSSTPLCRFYNVGTCRAGENCIYRHEYFNDSNKPTCIYYVQGICKYGDVCKFYHDPTAKQRNRQVERNQGSPRIEDDDEQEVCCGICFDNVISLNKKFGLLTHCDHVFCIECLLNWRSRHTSSSSSCKISKEAIRGCPTCRTISDYIVPSTVYLKGESKARYIQEYVKAKSVIPCERFKEDGKCPFFHHCFYQHKLPDGTDAKPQQEKQWNERIETRQRLERIEAIMDIISQLDYEINDELYIEESETDDDLYDEDCYGSDEDDESSSNSSRFTF